MTNDMFAARLRLLSAGAPLATAKLAVVCLHGRGGSAEDILGLGQALGEDGIAYFAPQADGGAWYPRPFMEPLAANEPALSAALGRIGEILDGLAAQGFERDRVVLAGFSQGACLSAEYLARNPDRVGALLGFSGGLIGPSVADRETPVDLTGVPVFLGCSERDPFIPAMRVRETAEHLQKRGASVTAKLYPGNAHTINQDQIDEGRALLAGLAG
ncbi:alpha/beta hydrolase [Aurantimonas endophytica]|uniref:Putative esterase n=1 Tax=Aurantimonas endophytica TaxID=1522175 RepID=A0A7W6HFA9_9HYPH|nr:dienelactone hydrolase family protein [Aurantimonas endophytica]MBB4004169.1 putative esterase [Aurantimonas endophytica]MCO6405012.1 phospholipase [Aurantimonas endophytica]